MLRAAARTPFYRRRFDAAGVGDDELMLETESRRRARRRSLPPPRPSCARPAGDMLLGGKVRPEWRSSSSSGSTGEPFRVYYDPRAWATLKILVKLRARRACGTGPTDRVALLDAVPPSSEPGGVGRARRPDQHPPAGGQGRRSARRVPPRHHLRPPLGAARGRRRAARPRAAARGAAGVHQRRAAAARRPPCDRSELRRPGLSTSTAARRPRRSPGSAPRAACT